MKLFYTNIVLTVIAVCLINLTTTVDEINKEASLDHNVVITSVSKDAFEHSEVPVKTEYRTLNVNVENTPNVRVSNPYEIRN